MVQRVYEPSPPSSPTVPPLTSPVLHDSASQSPSRSVTRGANCSAASSSDPLAPMAETRARIKNGWTTARDGADGAGGCRTSLGTRTHITYVRSTVVLRTVTSKHTTRNTQHHQGTCTQKLRHTEASFYAGQAGRGPPDNPVSAGNDAGPISARCCSAVRIEPTRAPSRRGSKRAG